MGEYARDHILRTHGVDIGGDKEVSEWKWQCKVCGKRLFSQQSNQQHMQAKHPNALTKQAK